MDTDSVSAQLDTIIALLKLTNREKLAAVRDELDDVAKALLEATAESAVAVGQLKKDVASKTSQSEKTVQRRIADLTALGALTKSGGRRTATYQSSGLI